MSAAPSRWGRCSCGATAEVLFLQPRCTRSTCRWYDAAAEARLLDEQAEGRRWYAERVATLGGGADVVVYGGYGP